MSLKEILKFMSILACVITVGYILLVSMMATINENDLSVFAHHLYRYPLIAICSVLPTLIFVNSERATANGWKNRVIFHFFLTGTIVLGSSIYLIYYWMQIEVRVGIFVLKMLLFIVFYIGVWAISNRQQQTISNELNERINEFNDD